MKIPFGTLGASLLGNMLKRKRILAEGAGYGSKKYISPPHPLTKFEIQKYYQNEPRFNGVCFRDK